LYTISDLTDNFTTTMPCQIVYSLQTDFNKNREIRTLQDRIEEITEPENDSMINST
jgi:hypothetical protein